MNSHTTSHSSPVTQCTQSHNQPQFSSHSVYTVTQPATVLQSLSVHSHTTATVLQSLSVHSHTTSHSSPVTQCTQSHNRPQFSSHSVYLENCGCLCRLATAWSRPWCCVRSTASRPASSTCMKRRTCELLTYLSFSTSSCFSLCS